MSRSDVLMVLGAVVLIGAVLGGTYVSLRHARCGWFPRGAEVPGVPPPPCPWLVQVMRSW